MLWSLRLPKELPENRSSTASLYMSQIDSDVVDGAVFRYLLGSVSHDLPTLCSIVLKPMMLIMQSAMKYKATQQEQLPKTGIMGRGVSYSGSSGGLDPYWTVFGPTVVVLTKDQQLLRMQCPSMSTIAEHSEMLGDLLQVYSLKIKIMIIKY